ncbi:MAG: TonB-dependent receptor plug domain-containing protein, partial [Sphingomonadales bacterium]|nr:TonB-dependent receptor plug domain-containing protein [Sphingomonadales bacterium]
MGGLRCSLLAGAAVLFAMPAHAQQAAVAGAADNEIIVTGLRFSMSSSADIKRTNEGIVEAVVAEDIGKLPDISVAETLARLPGVAAQRVDGRAQDLSIRGMGPKFGVTLLNGNEMVSTGDDRSFEYDQLPGELVNSMVVYKTSDVALSSQGLAGTIDIRTVQPLSVKKRQIALNARFEVNSYGKLVPGISNKGERLSASYVDQFMDGHLGIALGYTHLGSPVEKKYFNPWDFDTADNLWVIDPAQNSLGSKMTFDGFETGTQSIKTARDSFLGVLEYKSDSGFHSTLNVFHSEFTQHMRGDEVVGVTAGWAPGTEAHVAFGADPFTQKVTNATWGLVFRGNDRKDRITAIDWNNEFALGEWKVRADGSWSRAHRRETIAEMYATNPTATNYTIAFPAGFRSFGQVSSSPLNFASTSAFQLATYFWGPPAGYLTQVDLKDETKSGKLSIRRDWSAGVLSFVDVGATYAQRTKALNNVGTAYDYTGGGTACFIGACAAIP